MSLGTADASLACAALAAAGQDCARQANVFGFVPGHSIIVLYGCTAAYFLPKLLIVQAAAIAGAHGRKLERLWPGIGLILLFATACNTIRLALRSVSPDFYAAIHSASGGGVFDLLMILAIYVLSKRMRPA